MQTPTSPSTPAFRNAHTARELDLAECRIFLRRYGWGVLATQGDGGPYGIPMSFGIDGAFLFFGTVSPRTLGNLKQDSRVTFTVVEVRDLDCWTSVVVEGAVSLIDDPAKKLAAVRAIHRHRRRGRAAGVLDIDRMVAARFLKVSLDEMSGLTRD